MASSCIEFRRHQTFPRGKAQKPKFQLTKPKYQRAGTFDAGMIQRGCRFSLLDKPVLLVRIRHLFCRQNFYCYETVQMCVAGFLDNAHAAFAKLLSNLIT
jgi:hypothetical protein